MTLVIVAHMMRMTRAAIINVLASPYIEMARLKGAKPWQIIVRHALPNAWAPIVNVIALNLAYLVVGVVIVEVVFTYPGMGQLMVDAVSSARRAGGAGLRAGVRRHLHPAQPDRRRHWHRHQPQTCCTPDDATTARTPPDNIRSRRGSAPISASRHSSAPGAASRRRRLSAKFGHDRHRASTSFAAIFAPAASRPMARPKWSGRRVRTLERPVICWAPTSSAATCSRA